MTKRIFRSIALVALGVFLAALGLILGVLYSYFSQVQQDQLKTESALAAQGIAVSGRAFFEELDSRSCRITWVDGDGTVLYDTDSDPASMVNHLEREEVQEAMARGYGESVRYSETLLERQFYAARRLPDGSVVRVSCAQSSVFRLLLGMAPPLMMVVLLALALSLWLARRVAAKVVEPLNHLDLEEPLANENCDELAPLLHRIAIQQRQLRTQEETLRRRREEFDAVTASMSEGLVLLDHKGTVLSINGAAQRSLGLDGGAEGRDLVLLDRSLAHPVAQALGGAHGEALAERQGRTYQVDANPVFYGEALSGAVLLVVDVTEKVGAERMRREFTANVSHELRTPLHTISGSAELLCSGLVKAEDTDQFHRRIYQESQRMIRLVEDIINLSRLDEGAGDMERREVDLYALAGESVAALEDAARRAEVTLSLTGEACVIRGIPELLRGIAANLCDNAIKYNRPGGKVEVRVENGPDAAVLTVADTGIGIPPEHQARVFERFYRVDKSRSKAVGGTGLGLSIVKHAVMIHGGKISLESALGRGTTITIRFPKYESP